METTINVNDVKKDLYKSKVSAKFSHYTSGNLYYTVELADGVYQFPISTADKVKLNEVVATGVYDSTDGYNEFEGNLVTKKKDIIEGENDFEEIIFDKLSSDLGTTSFYNEMKGSDLNRWIAKAIDKNEFIKVI